SQDQVTVTLDTLVRQVGIVSPDPCLSECLNGAGQAPDQAEFAAHQVDGGILQAGQPADTVCRLQCAIFTVFNGFKVLGQRGIKGQVSAQATGDIAGCGFNGQNACDLVGCPVCCPPAADGTGGIGDKDGWANAFQQQAQIVGGQLVTAVGAGRRIGQYIED